MIKQIKIRPEVRSSQFGCCEWYFQKHIKDKPLIIAETHKNFVRAFDTNNEEWTVFKHQYYALHFKK